MSTSSHGELPSPSLFPRRRLIVPWRTRADPCGTAPASQRPPFSRPVRAGRATMSLIVTWEDGPPHTAAYAGVSFSSIRSIDGHRSTGGLKVSFVSRLPLSRKSTSNVESAGTSESRSGATNSRRSAKTITPSDRTPLQSSCSPQARLTRSPHPAAAPTVGLSAGLSVCADERRPAAGQGHR